MEIKPNITYQDFSKLDIRIGKIESAEKVQGSTKLIKLQVDFGTFKRQILAGIATKYNPEELVGLQLPVIVNLEARKMMGEESQGMILAIGDNDVEALLHPSEKVNSGSGVH